MSDPSDPSKGRVRRPAPSRKAPIRNWSTLFGPPPTTPGKEDRPAWSPASSDRADGTAAKGDGNSVVEGVQLGYKVVELHLKQAEQFAQILYAPFAEKTQSGSSLEGMTERMFRHASDLASAWMDIVRSLDDSASKRRNDAGVGAFETPPPTAGGAPAMRPGGGGSVSVEVDARRPFHATVDLRPGAYGKKLLAHDLRTSSGDGPRLGGVRVSSDAVQGTVRIALTIPDDLPSHTYSGVIVDEETELPQGMLAVRVGP